MSEKVPAIKMKGHALKDTRGDKVFFVLNTVFLGLLALVILYPLYFIVIASISDPDAVLGGQVVLLPVQITFEGFEKVFQRQDIWRGYLNTIGGDRGACPGGDHHRGLGPQPENNARQKVLDAVFHHSDVLRRRPDPVL